MYKLEIRPYIYYFETETAYQQALASYNERNTSDKNLKYPTRQTIYSLASIAIDTSTNCVIKPECNVQQVIEANMKIVNQPTKITIDVSGPAGSGKTRISALLNKYLKDIGFNTEFIDDDETDQQYNRNLTQAISCIIPKVQVVITNTQVPRSHK